MKKIVKLFVVMSVLSLLVLPTLTIEKDTATGGITIQKDPGGGIRPKA